ncbi:MAG TPA: biopolymer transporter ExbD [Terriglobales bacterium]
MGMNLGSSGKPAAVMNVTPLIDVLLVLLIIFMILTPLSPMGERALIPQPPPPDTVPDPTPHTVVLQIMPDQQGAPSLRINGQEVPWKDLKNQLHVIFDERREKVMFVKADEKLDWEPIANAIDIAHRAGVENIGLITARIEQASK